MADKKTGAALLMKMYHLKWHIKLQICGYSELAIPNHSFYSSSRMFSTSSPAPKIDATKAEIQLVIDKNKQLLYIILVSLNPSRVEAVIVGLNDIIEGLSGEQDGTYCPQVGEDSIGCCLVKIIDSA